ncbi:GGDEF domain-containing protein [Silanimonas sp.]|jgi:diguanylate cyclase (GGDEF)-like protein|uniref:GGDEF domain-containing protein n=1 Tax=Silanimonas sp. TaxID=1929290 RepID=UPI0022C59E50|nr:GGDEF domain-containing protein [Silanimonas sp.]MCZ8061876.1 GGDEF domain-containing protein [Silanimonas sp.]
MNRWALVLLGVALAIEGPVAVAAERAADTLDNALQAEMARLYALRTVDPLAFVARTRELEAGPPPRLAQRQFLQFLAANREGLEGRFVEAMARVEPLAATAEDPALRLMAGTYVINMRAGTREFEAGLRDLDRLLKAHPKAEGPLREAVHTLWATASIFYAELGKPELSAWHAQRLADAVPSPRNACTAQHFIIRARQATADRTLSGSDFERADQACRAANENGVFLGFSALSHARFLRDTEGNDAALALVMAQRDGIESTRYPRLVAEAHALAAELLLAAGRMTQAESEAQRAIETSKDTPTSLPVAMAEKVLFDIHRQRGDASGALRHLQRHIAANRALAEEGLTKERAFRTVQHESLQREQQLALATERNQMLDLEARLAKAESRNAAALSALLLLTVAGLVLWGWRLWADAQRFRALAQTDPLTGLATRQHFAELAAAALERGRADGRPLALVAFDLDQFKGVNDRHGHRAGDAVLRTISEAVRAVPAPLPCIFGRIGGEEFAVLLDGATEAQAATYAEALRRAIASAEAVVEGGRAVTVTASFGLSGTHDASHDLQALLDLSDRALYRAKNGGRDRVMASDAA